MPDHFDDRIESDGDRIDGRDHLTTLLRTRAERIEVTPDLDRIIALAVRSTPTRSGAGSWWLAVAAALLIGSAIAGWSRIGDRPTTVDPATGTATGLPGSGNGSEPATATGEESTELIVWLRPEAEPDQVADVLDRLAASPVVVELRYVDHGATWDEFAEFYADEPEVIDLVDPEDLPTSFRVVTTYPGEVGDIVTGMPGVDGVEHAR